MANANFRDLFPFDEPGSTDPVPGGLPGLLRQVAPEWRMKPGLFGADPASLFRQPGRAFDAQQLQALARQNQLVQLLSSDPADGDAGAPRDPNFRQLISRPQQVSKRIPGDESSANSDTSSRVALNVPPARADSRITDSADLQSPKNAGATNLIPVGAYSNPSSEDHWWQPVSLWPHPRDEDVAAMWKAIKLGWENLTYRLNPNAPTSSGDVPVRRDGDVEPSQGTIRPFHPPDNPIMPEGQVSIPQGASPGDLTIDSLADRFPSIFSRVTAPAADEPSAECKEKIRKARDECAEGFANNWKGTPHLGPRKNPDGRLWDTNDCARGIIEEECRPQGNPVSQPPPRKVKRFNLRSRRKKKTSAYDMGMDEAPA